MGEILKGNIRCPCGKVLARIIRHSDEIVGGECRRCGKVSREMVLEAIKRMQEGER